MSDTKPKLLENVEAGKEFILEDGRPLKNIYELLNSLTSMEPKTFKHHVTKRKNDFANWISHVLHDKKLAAEIKKAKTKEAMVKKINNRLSKINNKEKAKASKKEAKQDEKPSKETNKHHKEAIESYIAAKLDEIIFREKEMDKREQKIQEIEDRIEKKLFEENKSATHRRKFFSGEFVQGLITGILIALISCLVYLKFFY
jgi:lipopolysaccharide export LptBFGC system permease protein LptF